MMCLNHPKVETKGVCAICGNPFCRICLEDAGEHKICFDCIEAVAESSLRIQETSFLTKRMATAGTILIALGALIIFNNTMRVIEFILAVFISVGTIHSVLGEATYISLEGLKASIYVLAGYGVLMGRRWSYWLGLAISAGVLVFELYSLIAMPTRPSMLLITASAITLLLISSSKEI